MVFFLFTLKNLDKEQNDTSKVAISFEYKIF